MNQPRTCHRPCSPFHKSGILILLTCLSLTACRPASQQPAIPKSPARIVSLAPSLTEIVCALGAGNLLVGRTSVCNYPPDILTNVPVIGDFGVPSTELLLTAKPSLIIDVALADESISQRFSSLGLRRERVPCQRLDDIPGALETIGQMVANTAKAQDLARHLRTEIARLRQAATNQTRRPTIFIEIWNDPFYTVGSNSFLSELIYLAGGRNIGDEIDREYYQVSSEWVVARNPDIIFCFYMTGDTSPRNGVMSRTGWATVSAVRNGRVYAGFDNDILLRPGPRVLAGIAALRKAINTPPPVTHQ